MWTEEEGARMNVADEADYRDFVVARMERLRRAAYLLCHDWHTADDVVSTALHKLYCHWNRAAKAANPDAYLHRILVNCAIDVRRRPWWRREEVTETVPEAAAPIYPPDQADLMPLLRALPERRRAVLVLRFYCDRSVEETAEILGITTGTVKSQTARALDGLRVALTSESGIGR
jgi:RNA polymerase sigma-70 factor (sigma-E family)